MRRTRFGALGVVGLVLVLVCSACVSTVPKVDLQRYLGLWYQPLGYPQPFTAGLHRWRGMWVYTSRGTGYWGPPKRFGAPSEITCVRLVAA